MRYHSWGTHPAWRQAQSCSRCGAVRLKVARLDWVGRTCGEPFYLYKAPLMTPGDWTEQRPECDAGLRP